MLLGLIKAIFYIVTFYYIFKLIARFLLPVFVKKGFERMQRNHQGSSGSFRDEAKQREGTVTVKQSTDKKQHHIVDDNQGEYVDFEEIK